MSTQPDNATVSKALQDCVTAWLQAGTEFTGVPTIGRRKGNIVGDIEAAVAELGACVFVFPGLPVHFIDATPPYADRYQVRIRAIENPALNTVLPDCYELVELIVRRLFGMQFPAIEGMNPLVMLDGNPVAEVTDPERVIYDVVFETSLGFLPRVEH